jgi:hypothetical protein
MSPDRTSPPDGAFFALNMLVNTNGGDTYTEAEIVSWLEKAGLVDAARVSSPPDPGVIVARKPK